MFPFQGLGEIAAVELGQAIVLVGIRATFVLWDGE